MYLKSDFTTLIYYALRRVSDTCHSAGHLCTFYPSPQRGQKRHRFAQSLCEAPRSPTTLVVLKVVFFCFIVCVLVQQIFRLFLRCQGNRQTHTLTCTGTQAFQQWKICENMILNISRNRYR